MVWWVTFSTIDGRISEWHKSYVANGSRLSTGNGWWEICLVGNHWNTQLSIIVSGWPSLRIHSFWWGTIFISCIHANGLRLLQQPLSTSVRMLHYRYNSTQLNSDISTHLSLKFACPIDIPRYESNRIRML